jgi:hypothetical protein
MGQNQNCMKKDGIAGRKTYLSVPTKGQQCKGGTGEDGFWGTGTTCATHLPLGGTLFICPVGQ